MFEQLTVDGYRISLLRFVVVAPLLGSAPGKGETVNGLQVREHGLAGGEIHVHLQPENQRPDDPGYWYAIRCDHDATSAEDVVGTIHIKRMLGEDQCQAKMHTPLDELDRGHLVDRLEGEVLRWHALACGPGPFATPGASTKSNERPKRGKPT
jgi:hypothetical protein